MLSELRPQQRPFLFLIVFLSVLSGCAWYPQTQAILAEPPLQLRQRVQLEVPFVVQDAYQCGPASMAMVLHYLGELVDVDELVDRVYLPAREGSLQVEMQALPRSFGLLSYAIEPSLEHLLYEVDEGHPVLVLLNLGFTWAPYWHYAVVTGYDLSEKTITLHSADQRDDVMLISTFERAWLSWSEGWGLVVTSLPNLPVTALPHNTAKAIQALARANQQETALQFFEHAAKRWPNDAVVWVALANLAYELRQYNASQHAYSKALSLNPEDVAAWNNASYALKALNCPETAFEAAKCALSLSPNQQDVRDTVAEMQQFSEHFGRSESNELSSSCALDVLCPNEIE